MNLLYQCSQHCIYISLWIVQPFIRFCVGQEGLRIGQVLSAVLELARALSYRWNIRELRKDTPGAKGDFPR